MKIFFCVAWCLLVLSGCAPGSMYVPLDSLPEKIMAPWRPAPPDRQEVIYPREAGAP